MMRSPVPRGFTGLPRDGMCVDGTSDILPLSCSCAIHVPFGRPCRGRTSQIASLRLGWLQAHIPRALASGTPCAPTTARTRCSCSLCTNTKYALQP